NSPNNLSIATSTGGDGVPARYGFVAEHGDFAGLSSACPLKFIGPSYESIKKTGIKQGTKEEMKRAEGPVVPGREGLVKDIKEAKKIAKDIGHPVIIKATAGGGGKGIRVARDEKELETGFKMPQQEAETAFGNNGLY